MLTAVLAVATLATAMTFGSSLDHLVATPRLYGWAWDVQLGAEAFPDLADPVAAGLAKNPTVSSFSTGTVAEIQVNHPPRRRVRSRRRARPRLARAARGPGTQRPRRDRPRHPDS